MGNKGPFDGVGLRATMQSLVGEIQALYRADALPWIVGYSGGKDSTAALQLVWLALRDLPAGERRKPVHVISTDTLVENPVVAAWVTSSLQAIETAARDQGVPVQPHRLTPAVQDSYWVNLIGRGYPAPRHKFRWCTERLKIKPSNAFITGMVAQSGEAILVLGTRKAESQVRARNMQRLEADRVRDRVSPNAALPNCLVYSPIEDWTNDDVWLFLMQVSNPWGFPNKDLLTMYQGASQDGECPLVVDTTTPSCGDSRFGCWVCTLVEEDKSMQAMVQNDAEKDWMQPLLDVRKLLDNPRDKKPDERAGTGPEDREVRDFRRMSGLVQLYERKTDDSESRVTDYVPGPYVQEHRARLLHAVLVAQETIRNSPGTPVHVRNIELITNEELREIRRLWIFEKHEIEDLLPDIYADATKRSFPDPKALETSPWTGEEFATLRNVSETDLQYQLLRELLHVEQRYRTAARRAGLYEALEEALRRGFYDDEEDAVERAKRRQDALNDHRAGVGQ